MLGVAVTPEAEEIERRYLFRFDGERVKLAPSAPLVEALVETRVLDRLELSNRSEVVRTTGENAGVLVLGRHCCCSPTAATYCTECSSLPSSAEIALEQDVVHRRGPRATTDQQVVWTVAKEAPI